jgi:hypothetical protein
LADKDQGGAEEYRETYGLEVKAVEEKMKGIKTALDLLEIQKGNLEEGAFDWKKIGERAMEVLEVIRETDPVALKNAYGQLFEKIIVGDLNGDGVRELRFVLREDLESVAEEDVSSSEFNLGRQ